MKISNKNFFVKLIQTNSESKFEKIYLSSNFADDVTYLLTHLDKCYQLCTSDWDNESNRLIIEVLDNVIFIFIEQTLVCCFEDNFILHNEKYPIVNAFYKNSNLYLLNELELNVLSNNKYENILQFDEIVENFSIDEDKINVLLCNGKQIEHMVQ